jgi:hypothetical protein
MRHPISNKINFNYEVKILSRIIIIGTFIYNKTNQQILLVRLLTKFTVDSDASELRCVGFNFIESFCFDPDVFVFFLIFDFFACDAFIGIWTEDVELDSISSLYSFDFV